MFIFSHLLFKVLDLKSSRALSSACLTNDILMIMLMMLDYFHEMMNQQKCVKPYSQPGPSSEVLIKIGT